MSVFQCHFLLSTYRISGEPTNTDNIMNNMLWIGVYLGLTEEIELCGREDRSILRREFLVR